MPSPLNPDQRAQELLDELRIANVPIPVEEIAVKLGASVSYEPFEGKGGVSGMLVRDKNRIVIGINSAHPLVRQRFSIAHEIGHLKMHQGSVFIDQTVRFNRDGRSSLATDTQEIQANQFAAALLMPAKLISDSIKKRVTKKPNLTESELVSELATEFRVSTQAMEFRLTNLGIL